MVLNGEGALPAKEQAWQNLLHLANEASVKDWLLFHGNE